MLLPSAVTLSLSVWEADMVLLSNLTAIRHWLQFSLVLASFKTGLQTLKKSCRPNVCNWPPESSSIVVCVCVVSGRL